VIKLVSQNIHHKLYFLGVLQFIYSKQVFRLKDFAKTLSHFNALFLLELFSFQLDPQFPLKKMASSGIDTYIYKLFDPRLWRLVLGPLNDFLVIICYKQRCNVPQNLATIFVFF
jgi:hypothetical protein